MTGWLAQLDEADRGFLTWLSAVIRLPMDELLATIEVVPEASRIRELDLSPLAPRLVDRPRPLAPPFAGLDGLQRLDCSGLGLTRLDLTHLPTLLHLRCRDNALRQLDLGPTADLETLDCAGNALMTLDLRGLPALREVDCRENAIALIEIGQAKELVRLDCSHNQLMALDLGELPALRELRCSRNALVRLAGTFPALERVEAAHNELATLEGRWPGLRVLCVPHNRLAQLDLPTSLETLDVAANYLASLDLREATALEELHAADNQLVAIAWPGSSALRRIHVDDNRLSSVAPPAGPTRVLTCDRNHLARIETGPLAELSRLSCAANALTLLELGDNPGLVQLDARDNALRRLDLSRHPWLLEAQVDPGVALTTLDAPLFRVPPPPADQDLAELDALALHRAALISWRTGPPERNRAIVAHPACDWGTALLLYWTHRPRRIRREREALEPFEVPTWELLRAIEARAASEGFASRRCPFDPRDDRTTASVEGVDWTRDGDPAIEVPEALAQPSNGPHSSQPSTTTSPRHHES